ncbi:MAG TPA: hypothetical protein VLG11_05060 [Candidatus Saccharimonadales bacterium]|nr:hypothetical protein [Candidatus Saccharimonadales bacterium]
MKSGEWQVEGVTRYPKGHNPLGNSFYGYLRVSLRLPDGRPANYHGVDVGPCVHTVAVADDETTFLVRQRRPNAMQIGDWAVPRLLELPGGFADMKDEHGNVDLPASAAEELGTEAGVVAGYLTQIGQIFPSPGISNEVDTIFLGTEVRGIDELTARAEATEADMEIVTGKFGDLYMELLTGASEQPVSAQAIAAMAMAAHVLSGK